MLLKPGQTLSHYRLVEKIGAGGMGVVWKARDERLRRDVALKVLPPDLVEDPERRRRLIHEARAAAVINHPNIGTVYAVDEADDIVFFAMELVEGVSLRSRLATPLPLNEALRFATEVAEGLASAHAAKLIHRDLKPENVMVRPDGRVKILDFGLAKVMEERQELSHSKLSRAETLTDELTREGRVLGTAPYMSPEQAKAEALDSRSDIFSFGSMLYEMVTDEAPFQGKSATEILSAVLRDRPPAPSARKADLPAELDRIVGKCLEKEPRERYQDAADLAVDLRKLRRAVETGVADVAATPGGGAVAPGKRVSRTAVGMAVAGLVLALAGTGIWQVFLNPGTFQGGDRLIVADFENRTGQADLDGPVRSAFEMMLEKSSFFLVTPRRELKDPKSQTDRVDHHLAVRICDAGECDGYLIGGLESEGAGVQIDMALYRSGKRRPVITRSALAPTRDDLLMTIHQLILDLRKDAGESSQLVGNTAPPTTRSLRAYEIFVAGLLAEDQADAIRMFQKAVEIDPGFLRAYWELSIKSQNFHRWADARRFAEEALRRSSDLPERFRLDYEIRVLEASHDFYTEIDRLTEAIALHPVNPFYPHELGYVEMFHFEDSASAEPHYREAYRRAVQLESRGLPVLRQSLARALLCQGKADELEDLASNTPSEGVRNQAVILWASMASGNWEEALRVVDLIAASNRPAARSWRTRILLAQGKLEQARRFATRTRKQWLDFRLDGAMPTVDPGLAEGPFSSLPGFAAFSAEVGLEEPLAARIRWHEEEKKGSTNRFVQEELQFARGCLALIQGDAEHARRILEPIARGSVNFMRHRALGRAHETLGLWTEAAHEYEAVVRTPHARWEGIAAIQVLDQFRLAKIYDRLGNPDNARHWYERFLDDWKDADPGIPEVIEAGERLAALKAES